MNRWNNWFSGEFRWFWKGFFITSFQYRFIRYAWCTLAIAITLLSLFHEEDAMNYRDEERHHVQTNCTFQKFSTNGTSNCTYTLPNCNKKIKPCTKSEVIYDIVSVTVTVQWTNNTSVLALAVDNFQDATNTNFSYVYPKCTETLNLTIYNFVNNLMGRRFFECYVRPDKLEYVYLNSNNYQSYFALMALCLGHVVLLVSFVIFDVIYCQTMNKQRKDVLFYIQRHKVMKVQRKLKVENVNKRINYWGNELTPLLISSKYGYDDIMQYLYSIGADLECSDLNNGKTVFHYVCESHRKTAISWCIEKELAINIQDQQRRTPLITYVQTFSENYSCTAGLGLLVDAGADVTAMDKSGSTALHHICRNKNIQSDIRTEVIRMLVNAGCPSELCRRNNEDSPLSILLQQRQYHLCLFLIHAGYDLSSDSTLIELLTNSKDMPEDIEDQLKEEMKNIVPLIRLCRTAIRKRIGSILVEKRIELLPIPKSLRNYLLLKDSIYLLNDERLDEPSL